MAQRRLFVAMRPPEDVCEALLDAMEGVAGARWQDADNLHITLRFIGEADRHLYADVLTTLESVAMQPFPVEIAGVGHFEGKHRPNLIWARVAPSSALVALQKKLELACQRAGLPAETRKFVPHVTLARLNSGSAPIGDWLAAHGTLSCRTWQADGFALYESDLTPNGAIYRELAQFP